MVEPANSLANTQDPFPPPLGLLLNAGMNILTKMPEKHGLAEIDKGSHKKTTKIGHCPNFSNLPPLGVVWTPKVWTLKDFLYPPPFRNVWTFWK